MEEKGLVTYASKYGATAGIAEKIGETLRQAGLPTDVLPVKQVRNLAAYKAVVLGSAVYIGQWRKEAVKFLKGHKNLLKQRPVWMFSSGPTGEGDAVEILRGWRFPSKLQPLVESIQPHDIVVFHGNVDEEKINSIEKSILNNVKALIGDYRDWNAITTWATSIANTLKESEPALLLGDT